MNINIMAMQIKHNKCGAGVAGVPDRADGPFRPFRLGWQRESVPFGMDGGFHPRIHPLALGWRMLSIPASIPTPSIPARRDGIRIPASARSPWDGEGRNAPMPASGAVSPKSDAARTFSCRGLRCEGTGHPCLNEATMNGAEFSKVRDIKSWYFTAGRNPFWEL